MEEKNIKEMKELNLINSNNLSEGEVQINQNNEISKESQIENINNISEKNSQNKKNINLYNPSSNNQTANSSSTSTSKTTNTKTINPNDLPLEDQVKHYKELFTKSKKLILHYENNNKQNEEVIKNLKQKLKEYEAGKKY